MGFYLHIYGRENLKLAEYSGDASLGTRKQIVWLLIWSEGTKPTLRLHSPLNLQFDVQMRGSARSSGENYGFSTRRQGNSQLQMIGSSGVSGSTTSLLGSLYTLVMLNFVIFAQWRTSSAAACTGWWKAERFQLSIYLFQKLTHCWIQNPACSWCTMFTIRWVDRSLFRHLGFLNRLLLLDSKKSVFNFQFNLVFHAVFIFCTSNLMRQPGSRIIDAVLNRAEFCLSSLCKKKKKKKSVLQYILRVLVHIINYWAYCKTWL